MIEQKDSPQAMAPSMAKIAVATLIAAVAAAMILVVAVLPAEYGIDPLGTGKALGLTDLSKATEETKVPAAIAEATIMPVLDPADHPSKWGSSPVLKGTFLQQPKRFNVDSREITLKGGEGMEIKYNMQKGSGLLYSWIATGKVLYDFHSAPDVKPEGKGVDYFESHDRDDKVGKDEFHGTFVAPYRGIHGWFWENPGPETVTIKLVSAGFYDWVFQNLNDKETALNPTTTDAIPSHPKVPDSELAH